MEFSILNFIQSLRSDFGDFIMPLISKLGNGGMIWIVTAGILCISPKYRRLGITMIIALLLDYVCCNLILKPLVARERPFSINTGIQLLIAAPKDYSFPSGHTAASFASAFALLFAHDNKIWIPAIILASLIAFSRLYLYVHYPSDVIAGILLGFIIGVVSNFIYKVGSGHFFDLNNFKR